MRNQKYWTAAEDAIMREHYPLGGTRRASEFLPERGKGAVASRASALGLHIIGRKNRDAVASSEWIDAAIRRAYQQGPSRGKVRALAKQIDRKPGWVIWRAQVLGVSRQSPGGHGTPWTPEEDRVLEEGIEHGKSITSIQRYLKKAGYARSINSIAVRVQIAGLSWQNPQWTAHAISRALGSSENTVLRWLRSRKLAGAQQRGPSVDYKPPADLMRWYVKPEALREFMLAHPHEWDHRKVPKELLLDILCGGPHGLNKGGLSVSEARELAG
jgi:hypothetical protein